MVNAEVAEPGPGQGPGVPGQLGLDLVMRHYDVTANTRDLVDSLIDTACQVFVHAVIAN